jgi:hypothetical protein
MGSHGSDRMVHLPVQPAPFSTNYVSSNPAHHAEVYSTQQYVIKFVSDLWQVYGFSVYSGFLHKYNWTCDIAIACFENILIELTEHKKTTTYDVGNQGAGLGDAQKSVCVGGVGLNWLMGDHPHPLLITDQYIYKQTITKHCTCSFPQRKTTYYHKY